MSFAYFSTFAIWERRLVNRLLTRKYRAITRLDCHSTISTSFYCSLMTIYDIYLILKRIANRIIYYPSAIITEHFKITDFLRKIINQERILIKKSRNLAKVGKFFIRKVWKNYDRLFLLRNFEQNPKKNSSAVFCQGILMF